MPSKRAQSISAARWTSTATRAAGALGDFAQALRVGGVRRADHDHRVDLAGDPLHRLLAVGGGVADVFLVRRRRCSGSARVRTATIAAVSSTDSVVCVIQASLSGSRGAKARGVGLGLDQRDRAGAAAGPSCRPPRDGRHGRSARSRGPCGEWISASRCTLVTSGQVASRWKRLRARAASGTALATPCAEKITGWSVSGISSSSSTKTAPFAFRLSTT